jgi:DNA polymerase-1
MLALVDADVVLHRVGYTTDSDPEWVAKARCDEMLDGILTATNADSFRLYLSDSRDNNWRRKLYPLYKENRVKQKRPVHYDFLKEHLITNWGANIALGQEADDALGIDQQVTFIDPFKMSPIKPEGASYNKYIGATYYTVICSIDKDLLQVPGLHYNFVKDEWIETSVWNGLVRFYTQMLVGDTSDNIRGCRGIGPVKAEKALVGCNGELDLFESVYNLYQQQEPDKSTEDILEHLLLIGRLLRIRQQEEEKLWTFPRQSLIKDAFAESTP